MFRNSRKLVFTTFLNILGLSVAFAAFIIILIQVNYDLGYNKKILDSERVYRLEGAFNLSNLSTFSPFVSRPMNQKFATCSPNIEACGEYVPDGFIHIKRSDMPETSYQRTKFGTISTGILKTFGFEIVAGDTTDFQSDDKVLICESTARRLFPDENPVGKGLNFYGNKTDIFTIVAVYKDFPENCFIKNGLLSNLGKSQIDNFSEWSYPFFVKLRDPSQIDAVIDLMTNEVSELYADQEEIHSAFEDSLQDRAMLRLTPIHDTHFSKDILYDWMEKASLSTTYSLLTIAILIILIAGINFINFSMASVPLSIKSINTRKVLGESNVSLRMKQIAQAVLISLIAMGLAVLFVYILAGTSFSSYISGSIAPSKNLSIILLAGGISILAGGISGIYPAVYSTSFPPALVIKGSFSLTPRGRHLRTSLVALQYIISLILIIVAFFINVQSRYMKHYDMGYSTHNILTVSISSSLANRLDAFESKLKENPIVEDVTFAQNMIISNGKMGWGRFYNGKQVRFDCFPVAPDFLSFFGLTVLEGRNFTLEDNNKSNGTYIFNEETIATFPDITIGARVSGHAQEPADVVGMVRNFNFQPLQYKINPIALYVFGSDPWWPLQYTYVKPAQGADIKAVIAHISNSIHEMDPEIRNEDIDIRFMDENIGMLYEKEDNLGRLILIFCALSVFISIIGILGLIYFETQFKKREIGVRRVFGSSVGEILKRINVVYVKIASVCFVIAIPIAIYIIRLWLKSFTYQARIPVWIFIAAYVIIILITILVITLQSLRAASANPVDSVKSE